MWFGKLMDVICERDLFEGWFVQNLWWIEWNREGFY